MSANSSAKPAVLEGPWYKEVTREQWRAFSAVFLGWVVDAFDFNILAFIILDIEKSFSVSHALAGGLGTVTLMMRLVGGTAAGAAADKWGRKLPLMLSVVWFSLFAFLSGFSTSYAMLFGLRALFGIGMGGEWAAGMPLVFEHWPTRLRGHVSGLMLGGWYWGYLLASVVFQYVYPLFQGMPDLGWRVMFWVAIVPALFTFWIRARVPESPVWLEQQRLLRESAGRQKKTPEVSLIRIFQPDLIWTTIHTTAVISAFMCVYYSVNFWYPTFLREVLPGPNPFTLPYMAAFNIGAIVGTAAWGRISEGRLGRRGAVTITILVGMAAVPLYLRAGAPWQMALGALLMGGFGMGIWGMAPAYSNERFPTSVRGVGPGFCYHAAAFIGALVPLALGALRDLQISLTSAMMVAMVISGSLAAILIWLGPETRGRDFTASS
ncbi:MAG TPA: MFS transporter [Terriglobia bacterium]|nr:MFS transporter [Terriglobia bacterium]